MKSICFTLVAIAIAQPALAAPSVGGEPVATTHKSLDAFGQCFVETQVRASRSWWFVPKDDGGTFSNLGSADPGGTYFVELREKGQGMSVSLEAATPVVRKSIEAAVNACT